MVSVGNFVGVNCKHTTMSLVHDSARYYTIYHTHKIKCNLFTIVLTRLSEYVIV